MIKRMAVRCLLVAAVILLLAIPAVATEEALPEAHNHSVTTWTFSETDHSGVCADCGETVTEVHSYDEGKITQEATCGAEGSKVYTCGTCGHTKTETLPTLPHTMDEGVITDQPTCKAEGKKVFTCTGCGHTEEEAIPMLTDHVCNDWTVGETQHTGACIHCGEALAFDHSYDEGVISPAPTCSAEGSQVYTCSTCGHTKTETLPTLPHTMDEGVITDQPTCKAEGKKVFTCTGCGHTEEEAIPMLTDHVCNDWTVDETQHTGVCIHCGESLALDHSYDEGIVTLEPTCQAEGKKTVTCICGHGREETVPVLPNHVGGNWVIEEAGHTGTCIHCGAEVTGEHVYDRETVTLEPTCQAEGKKTVACICGHSHEETVPVLPDHVGGNWVIGETGHTGACIYCGAEVTGEHSYDEGAITLEPTCKAEGKKVFTCVCGHSYEETLPMLEDHVCGNWVISETGHTGVCIHCGEEVTREHTYDEGTVTQEPTCTAGGTKLLTCIHCGHTMQEDIPSPGHLYGDWEDLDGTYHQHTCICGKKEKKKHNWDKGVITRNPSCDAMGIKTYTCTDCEKTRNETTYMLQHIYYNDCDISCNVCGHIRRPHHTYGSKWYSDADMHWQVCTVCRATGDPTPHSSTDWIIDEAPGEYSDGKKHTECSICAKVLENATIPATGCLHGNEELRNQKDPTCTEEGYTGDMTCPRCEAIVTPGEAIAMLPHEIAIENEKAPTCAEEGYTGDHICQVCRTTVTAGQVIDPLPHETAIENQKDATCTEEGYSGDHICQVCRTTVTEGQVIDPLPHETAIENQKNATCTEEGYSGDHICQVCRTTVTVGQVVAMVDHETHLQGAAAASCTANGYTGDQVCSHCQQVIVKGQNIPALQHDFAEGHCRACGAADPNYVPPTTPTQPTEPATDPQPAPMNPMIMVAIAMLAITGIGIVVMIVLLAKKK